MKRAMLVTERTVTYVTANGNTPDGVTYNGAASPTDGVMDPNHGAGGQGINCSNYYRALITVIPGVTAGKAGTITALVGPLDTSPLEAAPNEAVEVPSFELVYDTDDDQGNPIVGEIFLQAVKGNPLCTKGANSLWIKHDGDGTPTITVVLEDPATEIADGRNTLQENAVYTG